MKQLVIILLAIIAFTACDEKEVKIYPTIEHDTSITISDNGNFDKEAIILASTINESIGDLEYEDSSIEDVYIEGVWINVKRLEMNEANSINLNLTIDNGIGDEKYLLDDFSFDIPETEEEIFLPDYLQKEGIDALHDQLKEIILNGSTDNDIIFKAVGISNPNNSYINIELEIHVKGTVVFTQTFSLSE